MILAVIQARMSSSRLPGKVMMRVLDKPLIFYLLQRVKAIRGIHKIVVATTTKRTDDGLVRYVAGLGIDVFRGSENDVLGRVYQAVLPYKSRDIVWITADCPLIDPDFCTKLISFYLTKKVDFAYLSPRFAEGLDCGILSFAALQKAFKEANLQSEHEHLTLYIRNHPELFKVDSLDNKNNDSRFRITVDEPVDFEVVSAILRALYKEKSPIFSFAKVKQFLIRHPKIMKKNSAIIRNEGLLISLKKDKKIK